MTNEEPADAGPHGARDGGVRTADGGAPRASADPGPRHADDGGPRAAPAVGRLERHRRHKVVAGVCGGLGRHYDVDPVIFRVPVAVLSVVGGLGLLLYGFAWLLLPPEGEEENEARRLLSGRVEGSSLAAVLCALAGSGLLLAALGNGGRSVTFSLMVLGAVGAGVHWSQRRHAAEARESSEPAPHAPPEAQAPPVPSTPSWWREPVSRDTGYLWGPADAPRFAAHPAAPAAQGPPPPAPVEQEAVPACQGRRLGWIVLPTALVAGWLGTAAAWSTGSLSTALVTGLSCALAVLGLGLGISAFAGRTGGGTIVAALLTAGLLTGAAVLPQDISTSWTDRAWAPDAPADVRPVYELGNGVALLDLTGVNLAEGQTLRSGVRAGAAEVRIIVPENTTVALELDLKAGGYRLPPVTPNPEGTGQQGGGFRVDERFTLAPRGDAEPGGRLELRVELTVGETVVEQAVVEPAGPRAAGAEQAAR
ncbi:PspC domain-containing protein [Streptomyces sp. TRM 70351]|uniref:PspC domain-containing protein n=1 Tax=Streptomyces sp. TRM 70351 TaxID=3116552 RepID=UPI002E7B2376|nr:PspC domain-containing protein [Streptomyces sp. TRM 70351]MEE1927990.1 PspC domain-containing protein [Streptomyces sp. TRM 70351]